MKSMRSNYSYDSDPPAQPAVSAPMTRLRVEAKLGQYEADRTACPPFEFDWHDKQFSWLVHYRDFMLQYFG